MTRGEHDRIMAQCRAALILPVAMFLIVMFSWAALAEEIIGPAKVIDGDTIKVAGQSIRLEGIDTHETADEPMGPAATRLLVQLTADREVKCDIETAGVYGRKIGVCRVKNRSGRLVGEVPERAHGSVWHGLGLSQDAVSVRHRDDPRAVGLHRHLEGNGHHALVLAEGELMISPGNQTSEWRLIVGFLAIVSAALFIYVGFIFLGYANGDLTWFDAMEQIRGLADLLDWETAAPVMVYILSRLGVKWKAAPSQAPAITAHDVAEEVLSRLKKEDA